MLQVAFHPIGFVCNDQLDFAVVVSHHNGKWIFCKHREQDTWEMPGGHREAGELIFDTAKRELYEETGSISQDIQPVCVYSVTADGNTAYGMLYYAEIKELSAIPNGFEIECICFKDTMPQCMTYPLIQPKLMEKVIKSINLP